MAQPRAQMKVGLVSPYAWTSQWGVNRQIAGMANAMAGLGHDVSIIAPAEERVEARAARRKARTARRAARRPHSVATAIGAEADLPGSVRLLSVPGTFRVPYSQSLANLTLPLEVTYHVDRLLTDHEFDILHIHEPYPPGLSFTALRLARCPVVATFHTAGERFLSYQLMRGVVERFFTRLDARICTSNNTRRIVSGYFPASYDVIGAGVDTDRFHPADIAGEGHPRRSGGADTGRPLVAYAAWSDPRKGLGLLLRTARLLPPEVESYDIAVVGGDELLWRDNLIVPRRLRGRVAFREPRAGETIEELYRRADILCAPYATSAHAGAILEAMASGTAVIAPGEGGLRELVGEGAEGLLLDHPYSYNLAADLVDLLSDARALRSMSAAATRRAGRNSWEKTAARIDRIYQRASTRRHRRAAVARGALEAAEEDGRTILADLHMHTNHSGDCATTPSDLLAACEECGLEAIAITDHNTISGALEVAELAPPHIHVIVGEEIKTTEGEIIGLYLTEEIPKKLSAEETIRRIRAQGGLVYVPHPFDPLHLTPAYELLARNAADIDIIEVYNPRITFTAFNEKARRLACKYDIPGGAGSDCHVVQGIGTAMLSLKKFSNPRELLSSLRGAGIIRSSKSPIYLHSLKLLKNSREAVARQTSE